MIEASMLVVGAGAIGGVTAAKMTEGVRRVAVLDANKEHVERMRGDGLLVDYLGEERGVGLDGPFDFALVTLKAPHLESALAPLLERGIKTEVDVINGAVVEKGQEYGVETPLNARVVELMHAMERGERSPGRDVFVRLRELA